MKRGVSEEKTEELSQWHKSNQFDEIERIALEYTEAMTYSDQEVSDELVERAKKHFYDDALVELTGMIAFQNMSSKFNSALAIPSQGFCKIPLAKLEEEE